MAISPPLCFMLILIQYPGHVHHVPGSCHTMRPQLDSYNAFVMGTIISDIIVGCCKGLNQSMPSKYVKKRSPSFWELAQLQYLSLGVIKPDDRCLVYAQEMSGCVWLDTTSVWAVISLAARIGFDLCLSYFL